MKLKQHHSNALFHYSLAFNKIQPDESRRLRHARRGKRFTLIELLVVICIIMMLVSLLLPALSKAKEMTRRTICLNNLKQMNICINTYSSDNDAWLPKGAYGESHWMYSARLLHDDYGLKSNLINCPSASRTYKCPNGGSLYIMMAYYYIGGVSTFGNYYGWYSAYFPLFNDARQVRPVPKFVFCRNPSFNPLIWDIAYDANDVSNHYSGKPVISNHANRDGTATGENMLFVDGHAGWQTLRYGIGEKFGRDYYDSFYW